MERRLPLLHCTTLAIRMHGRSLPLFDSGNEMKLLSIATSALLAFGAQSALAVGGPLDLSSGSAGFSSTPPAGGFTEVFTFTLTTPGFITGSITSVVGGMQDVDFTNIFLTGPSGVFNFTQVLPDPVEVWALSSTSVAAGAYSLALIGTNSASIGSYAGNLAVTPIPEPETYALLLAGMVAIGLWHRRQSAPE